jgi:hypothetical protein
MPTGNSTGNNGQIQCISDFVQGAGPPLIYSGANNN